MSSGLQHKMYNFEVTPPASTWEKIAAELDESELAAKFPSSLYNIQLAPPLQVWQRISAALDEPTMINDYSAKLAGMEVTPPVTVWDKIKTSLDAEQETIPQRMRISSFLKYAAAAVLIGFLAWGGVRVF
ncbi:MAG: hypothetical protein ABI688_08505, partial [Bacteroidota bacterium]